MCLRSARSGCRARPSPADVRKWWDRAKTGGEPRSTENSLLLEELRDHLAATDTDPAWRELAAPEVFGLRVYTYTGNMEIMTALAAVSGATVTAAILPFVQAIAAQAGQRSFDVARATTRRMIGRGADLAPDIHRGRTKVFVEGSAAGLRFIAPPPTCCRWRQWRAGQPVRRRCRPRASTCSSRCRSSPGERRCRRPCPGTATGHRPCRV